MAGNNEVGVPASGTPPQKTNNTSTASNLLAAQRLTQIKALLIEKYGDDGGADLILSTYDKLARRMVGSEATNEMVVKALNDLEDQADQLLGIFKDIGLDKRKVRNWLVKVIDKKLDDKTIVLKCPPNFEITSWVNIGHKALYSLVNASRESMGFFERQITGFPVREVTKQAFDVLFGDQSGRYEKVNDDVSLTNFTHKLKSEVLVFAGSVSNDALEKTLDLFTVRRFFLIDKNMMAGQIKLTLYKLALNNIEKEYPPEKDSITGNMQKRAFLINQLRTYYHNNSGQNLMINAVILGANKDDKQVDENGKETAKKFDYLKGYKKTSLLVSLERVLDERTKAGDAAVPDDKGNSQNDVFYLAGLATLCGEHGISRHLMMEGGNEKNVFKIDIKDNAKVSKALIATIVRDFGLKNYDAKWEGLTYYGPNGGSLRDQIKWLKNKPLVEAEVDKIDREKPETPVPPPDGVAIPASDDKITNK